MDTAVLIDTFKAMTLLELAEFSKAFEAEFGVSGTAPAGVALSSTAPADAETVEVQDEFDVILEAHGPQKIQVIKVVREVVKGLGLKEAKDFVESLPRPVAERIDRVSADALQARLGEAGATVTVL